MANDWNIGEEKSKGIRKEPEFAVLVGIIHQQQTEAQAHEYLDELEFLALTAGAHSTKRFLQKVIHPDA